MSSEHRCRHSSHSERLGVGQWPGSSLVPWLPLISHSFLTYCVDSTRLRPTSRTSGGSATGVTPRTTRGKCFVSLTSQALIRAVAETALQAEGQPREVQRRSTATSPHSHQQARPLTHRTSWDDRQTPSGAASSGRRGRRFKSGHPDHKVAGNSYIS